jgi:hypothetical protein
MDVIRSVRVALVAVAVVAVLRETLIVVIVVRGH